MVSLSSRRRGNCQRPGNRRSPGGCEDPSPTKRRSEDGAGPILKPEHSDSLAFLFFSGEIEVIDGMGIAENLPVIIVLLSPSLLGTSMV
ncbi:unnamed protein product [Linum trigynum]|uniref:Uncharacterized protein n=1 Tax=Linum trigynum TaxID=586398 RepID=A0AAV2F5K0_9ROSI